MALSRTEKERITDSWLKIQSVENSLHFVDPKKVPNFDEIQDCLEDAEKSLKGALRSSAAENRKDE